MKGESNTQSDLTQILDEMEAKAKVASERFNILTSDELKEVVCCDNPALVKALRRTLGLLKEFHADSFVICQIENSITAILNQGRAQ